MESLKLSILKSLYFTNPQSIADLSQSAGKSIPNTTSAINRLIEANLVEQDGLAPSTGGRRAAQFILNAKALPNIVSIAIDQFYSSVVVTNLNNVYQTAIKTQQITLKDSNAFEQIVELIQSVISEAKDIIIYAVGLSMPGFVDSNLGKNYSYSIDSPFYNLQANLSKLIDLPVFIENDSSAIAIAEHHFGQAKLAKNVMVVNMNWGVGLGMIIDNELYRGHSGYAGEFSHIPLSNLNKLCSCGKVGCLEVEASLLAAVDMAKERLKEQAESKLSKPYQEQGYLTGDQLLTAAINGDQLAIECVSRIGYMLGKGISTLIHIINPEMVVISGRGAKAKDVLSPHIHAAILEFTIHRLSKNVKIKFSKTEHIQLLGSTCICIARADKTIYKSQLKTIL
ncbi:ROK family transcriptional regulator [Sphingobacterium kyonggiense]|uniref:ROK family transcriptional regulator n=1 Tax=Sphingobacterium kyonggiense TaxID=714075 RepID=A0ABP7YCC3_9SPHI